MQSRRSFLRTSALGIGIAGMLPDLVRSAPSASPGSGTAGSGAGEPFPIAVDWHSHVVTPGELRYLAGRTAAPRVVVDSQGRTLLENATTVSAVGGKATVTSPSDIETRIRHLDANGVQRQLLSYTVAFGYDATLPVEELRPFYRILNDDLAAIVRQHPDRFLGVAAVPTTDPAWAARELTRAHEELGLIGVAVPLNAYATLESARTQAPLFAAAQKYRSHVFVHRAPASPELPGQPPLILPNDLNSIRWSIISNTHLVNGAVTLGLTDFLDPYPDVTVQVIMLGGFFPYLADTVVTAGRQLGIRDPLARIRRIYLDPGPYSSSNGEWVALAAAKFGADRILFGTDYGVGGGTSADRLAPSIATLDRFLTADQRRQIYLENSRNLLRARGIS
jgi:predicted TIM-barrel fold metal-dependent hydrolase